MHRRTDYSLGNICDRCPWGDAWSVAGLSDATPIPIDPDLLWDVDVRSWSGPVTPQIRCSPGESGLLSSGQLHNE